MNWWKEIKGLTLSNKIRLIIAALFLLGILPLTLWLAMKGII